MSKCKILAIIGGSGVGKTTVADILCKGEKFNLIKSYTTRPPRGVADDDGNFVIDDDEVDHIFVDEEMDKESIYQHYAVVAHTLINGNHYWSDIRQFDADSINVYVIDYDGLMDLYDNSYYNDVYVVRIVNDKPVRTNLTPIPDDFVADFVFNNNRKVDTFREISRLIKELKENEWL